MREYALIMNKKKTCLYSKFSFFKVIGIVFPLKKIFIFTNNNLIF